MSSNNSEATSPPPVPSTTKKQPNSESMNNDSSDGRDLLHSLKGQVSFAKQCLGLLQNQMKHAMDTLEILQDQVIKAQLTIEKLERKGSKQSDQKVQPGVSSCDHHSSTDDISPGAVPLHGYRMFVVDSTGQPLYAIDKSAATSYGVPVQHQGGSCHCPSCNNIGLGHPVFITEQNQQLIALHPGQAVYHIDGKPVVSPSSSIHDTNKKSDHQTSSTSDHTSTKKRKHSISDSEDSPKQAASESSVSQNEGKSSPITSQLLQVLDVLQNAGDDESKESVLPCRSSRGATIPFTAIDGKDGNKKRNISIVSDTELAKRNAVPNPSQEETPEKVKSSDNEVKKSTTRVPGGTKMSTAWSIRTWCEWAEERKNTTLTDNSDLFKVVNPDVTNLSDGELNYWLSKFVVEVRKKNPLGEPYPPNSLYQLCYGIMRHLKGNGRPDVNFFESSSFKLFQDTLEAETKRLLSLGVGANAKISETFSNEHEEKLWDLKLLGSHTPDVLLDTLLFLIGKNFGLRSGNEHRNLQFKQFTLVTARNNDPEKLVYNSPMDNSHHLKIQRSKRNECYSNTERPERCLVSLYKKYLERCPKSALKKKLFYLMPKRKWYEEDKGIST
ncbi:Zinc finger MYM-type protein 3 [Exaiptasia diaphana]|nr:Zinc finger MYM-type protein 3 [Exaiptasia diaphana]